ncbi:MAG: TM1802 family CRISPR-associated protein [Candidatus Helarchaeota archaeon]
MIEAFKKIGDEELKKLSPKERLKKFLSTRTINPEERINRIPKKFDKNEIVINLDVEKNEIDIKFGYELRMDNRQKILAIKQGGSGDKKYFSTNNLSYHTVNTDFRYPTVPALIKYIENYFDLDNEMKDFLNFLKRLRKIFYKSWKDQDNKKEGYYLNFELLKEELKTRFKEFAGELFQNPSLINAESLGYLKNAYAELVSKDVIGSARKNECNNYPIFSIKINGEPIHEGRYTGQYLKVLKYDLFDRFFKKKESKVKENALCSLCNKTHKVITGKIDIPTKFYQTTESIFFENQISKNAYKSFAICEECYEKVYTGINIAKDLFSSWFLGINYYLIPMNVKGDYKRVTKFIQNIIAKDVNNIREEMNKHRDLIKTIQKSNFKFDFLFFFTQQAQFIVVKHISDVYYTRIHTIMKSLLRTNGNRFYAELMYKPSLNSLYWLLFPNKNSHSAPDPSLYRKELTNLFESLLNKESIHYKNLISNFMNIFKKKYFRAERKTNKIILDPIRMNILLSFINLITFLRGGFNMKEGNAYTELNQEAINEFFLIHSDIYENNYYRQGLVLLGMLIRKILRKQKDKSSNFFSKLNLDGMPPKRLHKFINEVTEYLNIYKIYDSNFSLYSAMIDRLQGIEKSSMNKDEIIFYILTGISLDSYLGYKYSQEKKADNLEQ